MSESDSQPLLFAIQGQLNSDEQRRLSPAASLSIKARRRKEETNRGHRQAYSLDADRILHSRAYTRYIDKTQVFCLISNDHITHRVLHVQLVSRIARTIGRFLYLNEDLIEAIALGHDIGHPPFGHDGEHFLAELCNKHGLPPFQHNIQSIRFLDQLERQGRGWNLSLQTLDGILCHDGELHARHLSPIPIVDFTDFDHKLAAKQADPTLNLYPATMEGCVVRMADTIAYIGRDIEDAIILGLIKRTDIPASCRQILGESNGSIVYTLVTDLISHSQIAAPGAPPDTASNHIGFSDTIANALQELKQFNYTYIYLHPLTKTNMPLIKNCYETLFETYLECLADNDTGMTAPIDFMTNITDHCPHNQPPATMVRDHIAGMTDDFFLKQATIAGCKVPQKR
ncbi:MAG: HD domain-containing protein [Desulfoarculaceae bacterium]|nr:HD domain-containing protein [Desulfoarculaceae bacterium]